MLLFVVFCSYSYLALALLLTSVCRAACSTLLIRLHFCGRYCYLQGRLLFAAEIAKHRCISGRCFGSRLRRRRRCNLLFSEEPSPNKRCIHHPCPHLLGNWLFKDFSRVQKIPARSCSGGQRPWWQRRALEDGLIPVPQRWPQAHGSPGTK